MANLIPMTPERWAEKGCGPDGQPLAKGKAKPKAKPKAAVEMSKPTLGEGPPKTKAKAKSKAKIK